MFAEDVVFLVGGEGGGGEYKKEYDLTARGGTWLFFGWVCSAREPKLAPVLNKFSLKLIPRFRNGPIFYTPF